MTELPTNLELFMHTKHAFDDAWKQLVVSCYQNFANDVFTSDLDRISEIAFCTDLLHRALDCINHEGEYAPKEKHSLEASLEKINQP